MKSRLSEAVRCSVVQMGAALLRFPLALASALTVCGALIILTENVTDDLEWGLLRLTLVAALGVPLGVWIVIAGEGRGVARVVKWLVQIAGAGVLAAYFVWLPETAEAMPQSEWWRAAVLSLALHFGVSIAARHADGAGFWSFNWTLFSRFWTGVLYAVVFYAGLALALASAVKLFGFEIEDERYWQLWLAVTFGFHPLFLLAGVPRADALAETRESSKGLRIFAGGVLLPLVGIYVLILYPYAAKIAITRDWPNGWVAWPVLGLAVIGLLALLLVQPLARAGLRWAEWFAGRWFGRLLVPMAVLLGAAVWVRAGEYGLTESRYAGLVLAGWLAAAGIYFGTGTIERRSLKVIPWSLLVVCAGLAAGPWSLFAVAERSQLARLDRVLAEHGLLVDGEVRAKAQVMPVKVYDDLRSMMDYLHQRHRSERLYSRLDTWVKAHPGESKARWGWGASALTWLKVERAEDEHSHQGIAWVPGEISLEGYARATWVELRPGQRLPDAVHGVRLRLSEDGAVIEREAGGGWEPWEELNEKINAQLLAGKTDSTPERVTLWADIAGPAGEERRVVVLQAEGQKGRSQKNHRFWRVEVMVLAR